MSSDPSDYTHYETVVDGSEIATETIDLADVESWEDFARRYDRAVAKLPEGDRRVMQFEDELLVYVL